MARKKASSDGKQGLSVHFMASLQGNRADYVRICEIIKSFGYGLVTEHVLKRTWADLAAETPEESREMTKRLQGWLQKANIVVYEVSVPSVSIGYEIAIAFTNYIPVILLYREATGQIPHGLKGVDNDLLQLLPYNDTSLSTLLKDALSYASEQTSKRAYVQMTVPLLRYLDWIERTHKLNTSMYVRHLIEEDMRGNRAYQAHLQGLIGDE